MAKSILDIVIKLSKQGGADRETVTGLVKVKSAMMDAAGVAGTLVAAGYMIKKAFDATVGTMVAYADQVRGIQQTTGLTAEESSRLIQVLDDMKISYEDLQKVVAKNGDQFDYSIAGLSKMSDEYRSLASAQDKANFMQERFGKNWQVFVEAMEQGGTKLKIAGEAINDALILDDRALEEARDFEVQIDNVTDSVQALKVATGTKSLWYFESLFSMTADLINVGNVMDFLALRVQKGKAEQVEAAHAVDTARLNGLASLYATVDGTNAMVEAMSTLDLNYSNILGMAQRMSDEDTSYADNVKQVSADINLTTEERKVKLDELAAKHNETTQKIISDNFLQQLSVDGLEQAEFEMYTTYMVATGQMEAGAAKQALALNSVTQMAADGKIGIEQLRDAIALMQDKTIRITVEQAVSWSNYGNQMNAAAALYGYASGTKGWETVPSGFPNDTYPVGLTSGETFAVIPAGGGGISGGSGVGGMGGGMIVVNVNISSVISNADREMAQNTLLPYIKQGIRQAQAQGTIK